ncbi:MAG: SAM-dependent methyltransferase [Methylococcaceae bacterium]|nr:SAM-dependent methyltransferase [Methylococcaceae bacterium]
MELSKVVPWGRSLNEYREMFSLSERDLEKKLLGCGDGPACFNAELSKNGGNVISVDPIYEFSVAEIRSRVDEVYPQIMDQVTKNKDDYIWKNIINIDELGRVRMDAMKTFLNDYEEGRKSGRYIAASLPILPFADNAFDLALCSHYLFLYSEHVNQEQHLLSMKELWRVAREVRVYPLLSISNNNKSPHLETVIAALTDIGVSVSLIPVDYEFQKGATEMLVVKYA